MQKISPLSNNVLIIFFKFFFLFLLLLLAMWITWCLRGKFLSYPHQNVDNFHSYPHFFLSYPHCGKKLDIENQ